jgi:DNA polymerase III subunit delta'
VVIVASAQEMNEKAQNAFLKTLEEPPADTVLLLLASAPDKLLPTIRSRLSKVPFVPLSTEFVVERLKKEKKVDQATADFIALLSGGSLAKAFAVDVERLAERRKIIEQFEALQPSDARGWLNFAEGFSGSREEAEDCLRLLSLWTRDVAAAQAGVAKIANQDLFELATRSGQKWSPAALQRRQTLLDQAYNAITSRNGAIRLQLERMLIEMFAPA